MLSLSIAIATAITITITTTLIVHNMCFAPRLPAPAAPSLEVSAAVCLP